MGPATPDEVRRCARNVEANRPAETQRPFDIVVEGETSGGTRRGRRDRAPDGRRRARRGGSRRCGARASGRMRWSLSRRGLRRGRRGWTRRGEEACARLAPQG